MRRQTDTRYSHHSARATHTPQIFNVLVPIALKMAVDDVGNKKFPAGPVVLYGLFRFLTDTTKELRDCLYNHVSAYASRKISLRVFNHVQSLSLKFHLNRKTGAVLRAVSRGSSACAPATPSPHATDAIAVFRTFSHPSQGA